MIQEGDPIWSPWHPDDLLVFEPGSDLQCVTGVPRDTNPWFYGARQAQATLHEYGIFACQQEIAGDCHGVIGGVRHGPAPTCVTIVVSSGSDWLMC